VRKKYAADGDSQQVRKIDHWKLKSKQQLLAKHKTSDRELITCQMRSYTLRCNSSLINIRVLASMFH